MENHVDKWKQINLSQFSHSIKYVLLRTYDNLVFTGNWNCVFSDSLILASNFSNCLLYNYNGNVISKIGNQGRGPGEYQYVNSIAFGFNKNIYMQSSYDLLEFRLDGTFITKYKDLQRNNTGRIESWIPINDSLFFGTVDNTFGLEENKAVFYNKAGNVQNKFKNYRILHREKPMSGPEEGSANIYKFENHFFLKELVNDTLFYLSSDSSLTPIYIFSFGKYTFQPWLGGDPKKYLDSFKNRIWMENLFQTHDYFFLDCDFHFNFPAKRITPKTIMEGITTEYNTTRALGILNKKNNNLVFCQPSKTDNPLFTSGIFNDIDAGPRFFPRKMVNDSTIVMWIDAKQLKDHVASDDFKNSVPKYPEKKKQLYEFAYKLTEFDNAVLMFVTFKK